MPQPLPGTFRSDNYSGVHPEIMAALSAANDGHAPAYMNDEFTLEANNLLKEHFAKEIRVLYCFNGTSANVLALRACLKPYQSIICSSSAHIHGHEAGAPEGIIGTKLILLPHKDGKITAQQVEEHLSAHAGTHMPQPKVVSLTQATEYGTVYSVSELKAIKKVCEQHAIYLHVDGCRIYNAAVHLGCSLAAIANESGVDILSLGGTKNGAMMAEAALFFNPDLFEGLAYLQKSTLQLYSKNRFMAVQFTALFSNDLWKRNASHANAMAKLLAEELGGIKGVRLVVPCQTNQLFVEMPLPWCLALEQKGLCYILSKSPPVIRLVCSFDTSKADIARLLTELEDCRKR